MGRRGGGKKEGGQAPQDFKFDFNAQQSGGFQESALLEHIQGRLGQMVGASSGYLESLPQQVQTRIKALKHLHSKHVDLEKQFNAEVAELEKKYMALYQPLYDRRSQIVSGASEPTTEELVAKEEKKEETKPAEGKKEEDVKGVPEFWSTTLKHHPDIGSMITERDEDALKHLTEVKVSHVEGQPHSFTLEFHFSDNEFFEDKVIKKTYILKEQAEDGEVVYDHVDATQIKWKPGKDLTVKKVTKQPKGKGGRRGGRGGGAKPAPITVEQPCESFFNFFNPEAAFEMAMGEYKQDDDDEDDMADGPFQEFLEMDYELGLEFKEKLIPHAVMYFTGEVIVDMYEDDLDGEDDEDDEDDDDENDEDAPVKGSGGQQQQPECKQQ
eukprot:TRINITY_DN2694_c0_g1_i1.p1 TRINITY_DN2694_c0_g1~~TRINITY_DN2694_c0_g1_i1.p1  ORF type:complete len:382 (+),score=256.73 TRINITY_DN2694_c0_g1_i1:107-1252(+)